MPMQNGDEFPRASTSRAVRDREARNPLFGMPMHRNVRARIREAGMGQGSTLWAAAEAARFDGPFWGRYPKGFLAYALRELGTPAHRDLLHVCSGSLTEEVPGWRLDLRACTFPDVVADGRALPFRDGAFAAVLLDPPYTEEYARDLYGTGYPRPKHLLREAARVTRPGGRIGFVHFVVPTPPRGTEIVRVLGVTQGTNYRIRALTIYARSQAELPFPDLEPELEDDVDEVRA